jgi:hypothetical protein
MAEKIIRVRRKRRIRSFPGGEGFPGLRHHFSAKRIAVAIVTVVLAVVLGIVLFTYGSKAYNGWLEDRLLRRAEGMLAAKDFNGARQSAREVLELHRNSLRAYQILADATEKQNLEETVSWRAQIARLQPDNIDSQLNLASAALRFSQIDLARTTLERVPRAARDQAVYHVIAGWLARAEGNIAEQERQFAAASQQEPNNDLYRYNLAALQIHSADPAKAAAARASLEQLSQSASFRTGALRALLTDAVDRNDLPGADKLAQDLQMSPQVAFSDYLLCLNFYRKLDEKKFNALLEKVKPVAARDPVNLATLMGWMNENGLAAEVLKWMDKLPSEATDKPPASIAVAEAFADLKNWSRLRRWTRADSWENMEYLRLAYQAFAAKQSRQSASAADAEFDSLWRAARDSAYNQPDREVRLARLATKWNLQIESEELWSHLATDPGTRREALEALVHLYRSNNNLSKLYGALQRLHEISPNEVAITTSLARLGLNIDHNTRQAQELAREAYEQAPNDVSCAVTYAFSLYGIGRTTEGLQVLKKTPPGSLRDPHAATYVAVLLLDDNQAEAAKEYIQIAKRGPVYIEEKRLLEDELAKITGVSATPTPSPSASATPTPSPASSASPAPGSPAKPGSTPAASVSPVRRL